MHLSDDKFSLLFLAVSFNTIEYLDLYHYHGSDLTEYRIKWLGCALIKNKSVVLIKFPSENAQISDDAAKILAEVLSTNTTLREVHLDFVNISDNGASYLRDALRENNSLKCLRLPESVSKNIKDEVEALLNKNTHKNPMEAKVTWQYSSKTHQRTNQQTPRPSSHL